MGAKVNPVMVLDAIGCTGAGPRWPVTWQGADCAKPPLGAPPMTTNEELLVLNSTFSTSP